MVTQTTQQFFGVTRPARASSSESSSLTVRRSGYASSQASRGSDERYLVMVARRKRARKKCFVNVFRSCTVVVKSVDHLSHDSRHSVEHPFVVCRIGEQECASKPLMAPKSFNYDFNSCFILPLLHKDKPDEVHNLFLEVGVFAARTSSLVGKWMTRLGDIHVKDCSASGKFQLLNGR